MPSSNTPPEGFSDSDREWFDRLTGKAVPDAKADPEAVSEADALRLALERERQRLTPAESDQLDDEELARDWQRLQFALKREGLLPSSRRPRWTWPALGGLAAALLLALVLVPMWSVLDRPVYPEPPVLRGGGQTLLQAHVTDARAAAEDFAAVLQAAGFSPAIYQQNKAFLVDVRLQPDELDAARPAFQRLGLVPSTGLTRIAFNTR